MKGGRVTDGAAPRPGRARALIRELFDSLRLAFVIWLGVATLLLLVAVTVIAPWLRTLQIVRQEHAARAPRGAK